MNINKYVNRFVTSTLGRLSNRNRSNSTASQAGRGRKGSVLGSLEKVQKLHEDASGSQEGNAGTVTKRLIHIDDDDEDEEEDSGDEDGFGTHRGIGGHKHGKGGMKALGGRGAISNKDGGPEVIESLLPFEKNFSPSFFLTLIHGRFVMSIFKYQRICFFEILFISVEHKYYHRLTLFPPLVFFMFIISAFHSQLC